MEEVTPVARQRIKEPQRPGKNGSENGPWKNGGENGGGVGEFVKTNGGQLREESDGELQELDIEVFPASYKTYDLRVGSNICVMTAELVYGGLFIHKRLEGFFNGFW